MIAEDTRATLELEPNTPRQDFRARARDLKFRTAKMYLESNKLSSAVAVLLELFRERPVTAEGVQAEALLTEIAAAHEAAGRGRMALELYEKLAEE